RARAARDAAPGGGRFLRHRHGQRRGPEPAAQPPGAARRAAPPVHAHRRSFVPAGLSAVSPNYMQLLRSIVFTVFMAAWTIPFAFVYCIVCPFLPFGGRFWMTGIMTY